MTRRLLPYPALAAALFAMWLLLAQSLSPAQLLLGAAVSLAVTRGMVQLRPRPAQVSNWVQVARLAAVVTADIIRSNLAVAWLVLTDRQRRTSGFIELELELRDEMGLAILALIVTATPGTAWVQFDRTTGQLLIHVFDLVDEQAWIRLLKTRYEALLMEIFER